MEPKEAAAAFVNPEKDVATLEAALEGARSILVERFAENILVIVNGKPKNYSGQGSFWGNVLVWAVCFVMLAGAILTETIFSWPGIGKWMVDSVFRRDYPVVQGGLLLIAIVVMVVNLVVDLLYGLINPRVRAR